jgi:hypothetical protein
VRLVADAVASEFLGESIADALLARVAAIWERGSVSASSYGIGVPMREKWPDASGVCRS